MYCTVYARTIKYVQPLFKFNTENAECVLAFLKYLTLPLLPTLCCRLLVLAATPTLWCCTLCLTRLGLVAHGKGIPENITCAGVGMGLQVFPGTTEAVQVKCEGVFAKYSVTNIGLYLQSKSFARGTEGDLAELIVILPNKGIGRAGLANGASNETFMPPERLASLMHFVLLVHFVLQNCYCCWSAIWGACMKLQQWPQAVLPV
jgi:hypothetical protein